MMMFTRGYQRQPEASYDASYIFIYLIGSMDLWRPLAASGDFEGGVGWSTTGLQ